MHTNGSTCNGDFCGMMSNRAPMNVGRQIRPEVEPVAAGSQSRHIVGCPTHLQLDIGDTKSEMYDALQVDLYIVVKKKIQI